MSERRTKVERLTNATSVRGHGIHGKNLDFNVRRCERLLVWSMRSEDASPRSVGAMRRSEKSCSLLYERSIVNVAFSTT